MKKYLTALYAALFGLFVTASAYATTPWIDVSSVDVDVAPVATLALTILGAIASIWVVRKLIKLGNKS